jgi:hypothetical protein
MSFNGRAPAPHQSWRFSFAAGFSIERTHPHRHRDRDTWPSNTHTSGRESRGIKNFKHHADCFAKLGKDARHGFLNWKPPKQNMTLAQAQTLIRNLISAWVKKLTPDKG